MCLSQRGCGSLTADEHIIERQRQRSQASGITLSGADLNEYRQLCVYPWLTYSLTMAYKQRRRASANLHAVQERQQLETLRREEKNLRDALASVEDQIQQARRRREKLTGEVGNLAEREENVSHSLSRACLTS